MPQRRRSHVRLVFEPLEDRCLLNGTSLAGCDHCSIAIDPLEYRADRILVRLHDEVARGERVFEQLNAIPLPASLRPQAAHSLMSGLWAIDLPDAVDIRQAIDSYLRNPWVAYAEPDYQIQIDLIPDDPQFSDLWGLNNTGQTGGTVNVDIDAPEAWDISTGNHNPIVAVIDTGVDYNHVDLANNIWANLAELNGSPGQDDDGNGYVDDIHGYDFVNNDGDPMDDHNHGTHVAGTIGAHGNNGTGVVGVNWDVQIMAVKFLDASGRGSTSGAIQALNYAVANGAIISNNSWGSYSGFSQAMYDAISSARDQGHVFVAAAGNGNFAGVGQNNDTSPYYPATYDLDNVVAVAASDHNNQRASFSNFGANTVDLSAPGVGILSTTRNNTYSTFSGTSMATPHVTGTVALLWGYYPGLHYRTVIDQVLSNAVPNPAFAGLTVTGGQLNAAAAFPAQAPEIRVMADGLNIANGGGFDFGSTLIGLPITTTITITNGGLQALVLDSQIEVSQGFSITSPLTQTNLSFGETASFDLTFNSSSLGTHLGTVTILSNDPDESPYSLGVTAVATSTLILEDGEPGFATSGGWLYHTDQGFQNDVYYASAGTGSKWADWLFTVTPGEYEVAVTYSAEPNRATNAPFTVLDAAFPVGQVLVNQELTPDDFTDQGVGWERLGTFLIAGGNLTVQLTDQANEYVIADAVRIERVGDLPNQPEIEVQLDGVRLIDDVSSVDFGATLAGLPIAKTFMVRNMGSQDLVLDSAISVPPGFSVTSSFESLVLGQGQSTTFTVQLDAATGGSFGGQISFGTNDTDEDPFGLSVSGSVTAVQILDNGQAGFSTSGGSWSFITGQGYQNDVHYTSAGSGSKVSSWDFSLPTGEYLIAATWSTHPNRATDAPYKILDGGVELGTVLVNQEQAPSDFVDQGASWHTLGTFTLSSGNLTIQLSNNANQYVIADAIRVERVGDGAGGASVPGFDQTSDLRISLHDVVALDMARRGVTPSIVALENSSNHTSRVGIGGKRDGWRGAMGLEPVDITMPTFPAGPVPPSVFADLAREFEIEPLGICDELGDGAIKDGSHGPHEIDRFIRVLGQANQVERAAGRPN